MSKNFLDKYYTISIKEKYLVKFSCNWKFEIKLLHQHEFNLRIKWENLWAIFKTLTNGKPFCELLILDVGDFYGQVSCENQFKYQDSAPSRYSFLRYSVHHFLGFGETYNGHFVEYLKQKIWHYLNTFQFVDRENK